MRNAAPLQVESNTVRAKKIRKAAVHDECQQSLDPFAMYLLAKHLPVATVVVSGSLFLLRVGGAMTATFVLVNLAAFTRVLMPPVLPARPAGSDRRIGYYAVDDNVFGVHDRIRSNLDTT